MWQGPVHVRDGRGQRCGGVGFGDGVSTLAAPAMPGVFGAPGFFRPPVGSGAGGGSPVVLVVTGER